MPRRSKNTALALVEPRGDPSPEVRALQPLQVEDRALYLADLFERPGQAVAPGVGGELAEDERSGDGPGPHGAGEPQDLVPVRLYLPRPHRPTYQGGEVGIPGRLLHGEDPAVLQVPYPGGEAEAQEVAHGEDLVGVALRIDVVLLYGEVRLVVQEPPSSTWVASLTDVFMTLE